MDITSELDEAEYEVENLIVELEDFIEPEVKHAPPAKLKKMEMTPTQEALNAATMFGAPCYALWYYQEALSKGGQVRTRARRERASAYAAVRSRLFADPPLRAASGPPLPMARARNVGVHAIHVGAAAHRRVAAPALERDVPPGVRLPSREALRAVGPG